MADIERPSFSLGLDLDLESQLPCQAPDSPTRDSSVTLEHDKDSRGPVTHPGPVSPPDPPPVSRRHCLGPSAKTEETPALSRDSEHPLSHVVDDDIEEFSSEEIEARADKQPAAQLHSLSSSKKFSLHGRGIVITQSAKAPRRKRKKDFDAPSASFVSERDKTIFTEVTMSPLRRFQLLDSDSDDMFDSGDAGVNHSGIEFTNQRDSNHSHCATTGGKRSDASAHFSAKVDLWKDFERNESFDVPTPALDEFCKEYSKAAKDKKADTVSVHESCHTQRNHTGTEKPQKTDLGYGLPPAHCYFFHDDLRIQRLVQSRLCHFQPLFAVNNAGTQQPNPSAIDYMSQFNHENNSKQKRGTRVSQKTSSRKAGNSSRSSNGKKAANSSEDWINPKNCGSVPKDASKRRIHANGGSVGHWYTDGNGKKVYVSKNGQELSGQIAYRSYRKESGAGFSKSKKKSASRKKK